MEKAHHSFTRAAYDSCELDKQKMENDESFKWVTDRQTVESLEACFEATSPFMHNPFRSIPTDIVDIESDLKGQTRNLSRCPQDKFDPTLVKPVDFKLKECVNNTLIPEYTRTNRSCNVLSGISINRFHPLCEDPTIIDINPTNKYIGSNTRIALKDAYTVKREEERKKSNTFNIEMCTAANSNCDFVQINK